MIIVIKANITRMHWKDAKEEINMDLKDIFGNFGGMIAGIFSKNPKRLTRTINFTPIKNQINNRLAEQLVGFNIVVDSIKYYVEDGRMFLKFGIEKIDLDKLFDYLIEAFEKSEYESAAKSGETEPDSTKKMIIGILKALNNEISMDRKYNLIQVLLEWINENNAINTVLGVIGNQDNNISRVIGSLDLAVGNVTLDFEDTKEN